MFVVLGHSQIAKEQRTFDPRTFFKSPDELMKIWETRKEGSKQQEANKIGDITTLQCDVQTTHPWRYNTTSVLGDTSEIIKSPLQGRVGIGACKPRAKLHVFQTFKDYGTPYAFLVEREELAIIHYPSGISSPSYTSLFSVTRAGDVGIFTDSPKATLDIAKQNASMYLGNKNSQHFWLVASDYPNFPFNIFNSSQPLLFNFTGAPVYFGFWNNGRVLVDGVVGVGTYAPQARLHVNRGNLRISNGHAYIAQGKMGIGINPNAIQGDYRLAVCGKILVHEVRVQNNGWCDYVFEEDYPLKPWKEVVQYYKTHKHLPGVPSQEEVEKEGIYVAEMNRILLEKVEELYRYIEQLEQRVRELEKK